MKKQYVSPTSEVIALNIEGSILAASLDVREDITVGGSDVLSNRKNGWDSSQWSSSDEVEE